MKSISLLTTAIALITAISVSAEGNTFDINMKKTGAPIQSTMYGIFFEDINYAADGGLYAELVKNRSFEFPNALQGWKIFGNVEVRNDGPFERNPHYVRLTDPGHAMSSFAALPAGTTIETRSPSRRTKSPFAIWNSPPRST